VFVFGELTKGVKELIEEGLDPTPTATLFSRELPSQFVEHVKTLGKHDGEVKEKE
jgi:hypothetical protein